MIVDSDIQTDEERVAQCTVDKCVAWIDEYVAREVEVRANDRVIEGQPIYEEG